jgi:hypothetical protein
MCWTAGHSPEQWSAAGTWVQAIAAALTFIVAAAAAWFAKNQVREARTPREAQAEPFVTASLISKSKVAHLLIAPLLTKSATGDISGRRFSRVKAVLPVLPVLPG